MEINKFKRPAIPVCPAENGKRFCNKSKNVLNTNQAKCNEGVISSWREEYEEGDSIFSDIVVTAEDAEEEFHDFDDDFDEIQCTQRFIKDINISQSQTQLDPDITDFTKYICGSQYLTKEEIRTHIEVTRNDTLNNEINNIPDISWSSQSFSSQESLLFNNKGSFYGLPSEVETLIYSIKGINNLYDWQKECLQLPAIRKRHNLLYALPTSGGKTLVSEILMLREIICREKNVIFVLPYVSIVQEKVSAMAPFALKFNFLVEEYTAGKGRCPPTQRWKRKSIFISSIEKAAVLFDSLIDANRANEIGLVVVDELHLIGEKGRGSALEAFLAKIMYIKAGIQVVGMSATIGNLPELSKFLEADVYTRGFRPVELKEYIKCGNEILEINNTGSMLEEIFVYKRTVNYKYSPSISKADPDHLAGLVSEVIPTGSCLIFCSTRKNCENVAILLTKILPRDKYTEHRKQEKQSLMGAIENMCGILSPLLAQTIPFGIAYHHSGLTTDERKLLEMGYRLGTICVICCTSTLAAGVNLPAKRVIIRAPYVGKDFMTLCRYKQMVGRAGRAGLGDAGESILICSARDNAKVGEMLFAPMDEVMSDMVNNDAIGMQSLILSAVGLKIADCLRDLLKLASNTLLAVQAGKLDISIEGQITEILRNMFKRKILVPAETSTASIDNDMITTQEIREKKPSSQENNNLQPKYLVLSKSTKFCLTNIGKAAYKAGIDYKRAESSYNILYEAQKSLVLRNHAHLLYLVMSFISNDDYLIPDTAVFFREYTRLDKNVQYVARAIGITEAYAAKMAVTKSLKGPVEIQLSRFFKVLVLNDVLNLVPTHVVASKFFIERGQVQNLIAQSLSATSSIVRLCDEIEEFWCYKPLFENLMNKLDQCCTIELAPLLDLPAVKLGRAKQLFHAGYRTMEDIAKAKPIDLVHTIEYMSIRVAREIVSAAKVNLLNKLEVLQKETELILSCFQ